MVRFLGNVIESFRNPVSVSGGLAWDGEALWCVDVENKTIERIDPENGKVLHSILTPAAQPKGLLLVTVIYGMFAIKGTGFIKLIRVTVGLLTLSKRLYFQWESVGKRGVCG